MSERILKTSGDILNSDSNNYIFENSLLENCDTLPAGYKFRPLEFNDFSRGYYSLLSQLTVIGDENDEKLFQDTFKKLQLNADYNVLVIEDTNNDLVVASGSVIIERKFIRNAGVIGHIEDIVVHSDMRGKNFGKLLIDELVKLSIKAGSYKTILACDKKNVGFYEKTGFVEKEVSMSYYHIKKN
ncbi:hypothetical protein HDU92_005735 [Lobulomyces angularis]|nr:hypothetical protein HDU92_005735 [Lobulomyces angularis]